MFTGIIEHMGRVKELRRAGEGSLLVLELGPMAREVRPGESISVEGVCLTVTGLKGEQASFDVSQETLKCSTLGGLRVGQGVNLERSLKVGDRMGDTWTVPAPSKKRRNTQDPPQAEPCGSPYQRDWRRI